jgi:MoaA/NifB/PqqE/SkfB family radical SAM enzyme
MTLPFVVSPYLRPFRDPRGLLVDNGVTSEVHRPDPVEEAVLSAVWDAKGATERLDRVIEEHGADAVCTAVESLTSSQLLFESRQHCDLMFDRILEATRHEVPFVDQVELTNLCPFKCGFCPRGVPGRMKRPTGKMDPALFERLLDQLHPQQGSYRPLELHHLGESLLHPDVDRMVAAASARGLPTELSVNPSLLTAELGRRLLDAGIARLVISLDGMDDETLIAIRGPAAVYSQAERHLDALLEMVAAQSRPATIVIQMIDLHRNRHQREAFLERWGLTGLPTVQAFIKDLDGDDPLLGRPSPTPLSYLCAYPWRSVVVLWDGRVVPCCRDDDAVMVLGDLRRQTLAEIWNGLRVRALRAQHLEGCFPAGHLCAGCPWGRPHFAEQMPARHPTRARLHPLQW